MDGLIKQERAEKLSLKIKNSSFCHGDEKIVGWALPDSNRVANTTFYLLLLFHVLKDTKKAQLLDLSPAAGNPE